MKNIAACDEVSPHHTMEAKDIAETVYWVATLAARVNVDLIQLMPVQQALGALVIDRSSRPVDVQRHLQNKSLTPDSSPTTVMPRE